MNTPVKLARELEQFLARNRHCLTRDEVTLIRQVIDELNQLEKKPRLTLADISSVARIVDMITQLMNM